MKRSAQDHAARQQQSGTRTCVSPALAVIPPHGELSRRAGGARPVAAPQAHMTPASLEKAHGPPRVPLRSGKQEALAHR